MLKRFERENPFISGNVRRRSSARRSTARSPQPEASSESRRPMERYKPISSVFAARTARVLADLTSASTAASTEA
jgi:hypothetical protein